LEDGGIVLVENNRLELAGDEVEAEGDQGPNITV